MLLTAITAFLAIEGGLIGLALKLTGKTIEARDDFDSRPYDYESATQNTASSLYRMSAWLPPSAVLSLWAWFWFIPNYDPETEIATIPSYLFLACLICIALLFRHFLAACWHANRIANALQS